MRKAEIAPAALLGAGAGALILAVPATAFLLGAGAAGFLGLLLARPDAAVVLLLVLRTSLDAFTESRLRLTDFTYLNVSGLMAAGVTLLALAFVAAGRITIRRSAIEISYLAFLGYALATLAASADPAASAQEWFRVASPFALYLLTSRLLVEKGRASTVLAALVLSAAAPVAAGLWQVGRGSGLLLDDRHAPSHGGPGADLAFERVPGTFVLPMSFGFYLVTLLPLLLVEHRRARGRARAGLAVLLAAAPAMLVLTYTRGAWLAALAAITVLGVLRFRRLLAVPAILAGLALLAPGLLGPITRRFTDILDPALYQASTAATRLDLWRTALTDLFPQRPLFGHGLGTFPELIARVRWVEAAHNDYLRLLVETGVVGLGIYLWVLGAIGAAAAAKYRAAREGAEKDRAAAFLAVFCAFLLAQAGDNLFGMPVIQFYFWAFLALVTGSRSAPSGASAPAEIP